MEKKGINARVKCRGLQQAGLPEGIRPESSRACRARLWNFLRSVAQPTDLVQDRPKVPCIRDKIFTITLDNASNNDATIQR